MTRTAVTSEILDRLPPHDLDAEKSVLGCLLLDPARCGEVGPILTADDFYGDANRRLYAHALGFYGTTGRLDETLLIERLRECGDLEAIGGTAYLAEVIQSVGVAGYAVGYAKIVAKKAKFRALILATTEALRDAYDAAEEPEEIVSRTAEKLLNSTVSRQSKTIDTSSIFSKVLADAANPAGPRSIGKTTGLFSFDREIGGLYPGELAILAARPSMGKTALATQVFLHFAERTRHTLFISMEMSAESLAGRIMASRAGLDSQRVRTGCLDDDDRRALTEATGKLPFEYMHLVDRSRMTTAEVRWEIMRLQQRQPIELVVVDYLTRLQPADPRAQRYLQVGQMTGDLKQLALEFEIPILCLAQLGRKAEEKGEGRPRLSHLRESGDIEQDADVVAFLHRPERVDRDDWDVRGKAWLYVEKNRNGPCGDFELRFEATTGKFTDPAAVTSWSEFDEFA